MVEENEGGWPRAPEPTFGSGMSVVWAWEPPGCPERSSHRLVAEGEPLSGQSCATHPKCLQAGHKGSGRGGPAPLSQKTGFIKDVHLLADSCLGLCWYL